MESLTYDMDTWFYEYFSISDNNLSDYNFKEVPNNFEFNF